MIVDVDRFLDLGFVVLRDAFDAEGLAVEMRAALVASGASSFGADVDSGTISVEYVPMMCAQTPHSLALLDALQPVAAALVGGAVLPTRAKGVRYRGETPWHVDTRRAVASVGFAAYLEPLDAGNGALRVVPRGCTAAESVVVATQPGDVIAFDEHLLHSSTGGGARLQWRADYVRDDGDVAGYYADIFPAEWPRTYDAAKFPSYGPSWLASSRPCVARLRALGVYDLARDR
jgi:hypothetical protein